MATQPRRLTSDLVGLLEHVRRSVLRLSIVVAVAIALPYRLGPDRLHFLTRPLGAPPSLSSPLQGFITSLTSAPDAFTVITLLLPLLGLYDISIVLMRLAERRQKTRVTRV